MCWDREVGDFLRMGYEYPKTPPSGFIVTHKTKYVEACWNKGIPTSYSLEYRDSRPFSESPHPKVHLAETMIEAMYHIANNRRVYLSIFGREIRGARALPRMQGDVYISRRTIYFTQDAEACKKISNFSRMRIEQYGGGWLIGYASLGEFNSEAGGIRLHVGRGEAAILNMDKKQSVTPIDMTLLVWCNGPLQCYQRLCGKEFDMDAMVKSVEDIVGKFEPGVVHDYLRFHLNSRDQMILMSEATKAMGANLYEALRTLRRRKESRFDWQKAETSAGMFVSIVPTYQSEAIVRTSAAEEDPLWAILDRMAREYGSRGVPNPCLEARNTLSARIMSMKLDYGEQPRVKLVRGPKQSGKPRKEKRN